LDFEEDRNRLIEPVDLVRRLIYSNLAVDATRSNIILTCMEAEQLGIPRILVNAVNVSLAANQCTNFPVKVGAALSYPVGAYPAEIKGLEIEDAVRNGADEIFMLMALGIFLDGFYDEIQRELDILIEKADQRPTYYMIEAGAMNNEHLTRICKMVKNAGVDYLVSSSNFKQGGFHPATEEQIAFLAKCEEGGAAVVANVDIKTRSELMEYLYAGASRICTPDAVNLLI
jgi:deoxyribose-phosphate aldolase